MSRLYSIEPPPGRGDKRSVETLQEGLQCLDASSPELAAGSRPSFQAWSSITAARMPSPALFGGAMAGHGAGIEITEFSDIDMGVDDQEVALRQSSPGGGWQVATARPGAEGKPSMQEEKVVPPSSAVAAPVAAAVASLPLPHTSSSAPRSAAAAASAAAVPSSLAGAGAGAELISITQQSRGWHTQPVSWKVGPPALDGHTAVTTVDTTAVTTATATISTKFVLPFLS